jgi:hypothetical protein
MFEFLVIRDGQRKNISRVLSTLWTYKLATQRKEENYPPLGKWPLC